MSKKLRYFSLAGVSVIASLFIIAAAFNGIVYIADYARSVFIRCFGLYESGDGVTVISGNGSRKYIRTYDKLPAGMFHFGNLLIYRGGRNVTIDELSPVAIELTRFYRLYSMKEDLIRRNRIVRGVINSGETVFIGKPLPPLIPDIRNGRERVLKFTKGLYFTGESAGSEKFISKLPLLKTAGINAIVFDVKDITGIVHIRSRNRVVAEYGLSKKGAIDNLPMLVRECRENGIYVIARIAVFHDHMLWDSDPSVRIKSRSSGRDWNRGSHEKWCDPTDRRVQDYNIALAAEVADSGVDEVQFDYIRFPTLGDQADAAFKNGNGSTDRVEVITEFLKRADEALKKYGVFLSVDIFGVVAWGKGVDINRTGQNVSDMAGHCDAISPMLYPSHFNDNFDGFKNPGDHPYHFILEGCKKVIGISKGRAVVRPWLQAFGWRVSNYNASYIKEQVRGAEEAGSYGYLFWNASNKYEEVFRGMEK